MSNLNSRIIVLTFAIICLSTITNAQSDSTFKMTPIGSEAFQMLSNLLDYDKDAGQRIS